jgi:hypothetical protein
MKKVFASFLILVGLVVGVDELASARSYRKENTPTLRLIEEVGRQRGASPKLIKVLKVIACKESACGRNPVAAREKSKTWARKAARIAKSKREFEELMHSYGSMQLSGLYTKLEYGAEPVSLFDDEVAVPIAYQKAEKIFEACKGSEYCSYARWNGSGPMARKYARAALKLEANV